MALIGNYAQRRGRKHDDFTTFMLTLVACHPLPPAVSCVMPCYAVSLHAGAFGYFKVTHDITKYCKADLFSEVGKTTPVSVRFSTVGEFHTKECCVLIVCLCVDTFCCLDNFFHNPSVLWYTV